MFFQISSLIPSFPLFIHLFLILHLCFLRLQFFFTPLNLSFKTQLCEFLWSKWKGGSLADWITGLNLSFPCNSMNHLHSCYGLKVAGIHAPLHDLGMFTCHLHEVTYFCHHCEHMAWGTPAPRVIGWDRKCKPDTDLQLEAKPSKAQQSQTDSTRCAWKLLEKNFCLRREKYYPTMHMKYPYPQVK